MARIFKWTIEARSRQLIHVPQDTRFISVGVQNEFPVVWGVVPDDQAPAEPRVIRLVTTGEEFNDEGLRHIGSVTIQGWFVGHVFEQSVQGAPDPVSARFKDDLRDVRRELDGDPQLP